jgi:hypothetical protein
VISRIPFKHSPDRLAERPSDLCESICIVYSVAEINRKIISSQGEAGVMCPSDLQSKEQTSEIFKGGKRNADEVGEEIQKKWAD